MTKPGIPAIDRVLDKCTETGSGCWEYGGALSHGYGAVRVEGRTRRTHRITYEELVGDIPDGLVLDHLCENPPCCNPWHLDPVPRRVNTQRHFARTHCPAGHEMTEENTYRQPSGVGLGSCRKCIKLRPLLGTNFYVIGWLESFDDPFAILDALREYLIEPPARRLWGDDVPRQPVAPE